jgi:predicted dehydrogenase
MNASSDPSRREFLAATTSLAAAVTAALTVLPAAAAANESIRVGLIGVGGRCRHLLTSLVKIADVNVAAACDVYEPNLHGVDAQIDPQAHHDRDFRALLDRKDIDAVLIATPDHWHVPITIAACEAGKDVYVEKPLTHELSEGQAVIDAQNKYQRVVQVGMQQRSMPHIQKARELVAAGRCGKVIKMHLTWNRNADRMRRGPQGVDASKLDWKAFLGNVREQPFDEYRYRNWRWFWDFGGGLLTDLMVHWIDVGQWILGLDHPDTAVTIGGNPMSAGVWETPDTVQTLQTYGTDVQSHFEGTFGNAREGNHIVLMGTDASLYIDRGRFELIPERGKGERVEMIVGSGPKGQDFFDKPDGELLHLTDWVEAMRSRRKPTAPAEAGVAAAAAAHLGNIAFRTGATARWPG